jgi:hypothetical protein
MKHKMKLNYRVTIGDIECICKADGTGGYFSYQESNELDQEDVWITECTENQHFYQLYNKLQKEDRAIYVYSIDYDKAMINFLGKLIELERRGKIIVSNYNKTLRDLSDFLINKDQLYFFRLNGEFWMQDMKKIEKLHHGTNFDTKYKLALKSIKSRYSGRTLEFLEKYHLLLGKSKLFKSLNILEIPKIYYYYNVDVTGKIKPSIGLKNLQLLHEGVNQKFDFNTFDSADAIKEAGLWDYFIEYSKNDVQFLKKLFLDKPLKDIQKRMYAVKAIQMIDPDFYISDDVIYSENNTRLITEILKIDNPNKDIDIDYTNYIKTDFKKFNDFVSFVNIHKDITKDKELKKLYCSEAGVEYIQDDTKVVHESQVQTIINSIDIIDYKGTPIKVGLGGIHAALDNYIAENLVHLDYASQYPSTILQYRKLFGQVINVDLYEAVYNMRLEYKAKKGTLIEGSEEWIEADLIEGGLKLILNTAFGLINSEFNIAIACKTLGRFICLKGQSLLLNLCSKLHDSILINGNTDGIIIKVGADDIDQIIKDDEDRYYTLSRKNIDLLIQNDVNTYIMVVKGKVKVKGRFKNSVQSQMNQSNNLSCNLQNALNLIGNKEAKITPIVFHKKINLSAKNKRFYLTDKDRGAIAIKQNNKPIILNCNDEEYYFTPDETNASLAMYKRYAEMTLEKIKSFTLNAKEKPKAFIECALEPDTVENTKLKKSTKLKLGKIFDKDSINIGGYKGSHRVNVYSNKKPIKPYIHYTMTQILGSTESLSLNWKPTEKYICISVEILNPLTKKAKKGWQICKPFLSALKEAESFECWCNNTRDYNRYYIFKNTSAFTIPIKLQNFIKINDSELTLWSLNDHNCTFNIIKDINAVHTGVENCMYN